MPVMHQQQNIFAVYFTLFTLYIFCILYTSPDQTSHQWWHMTQVSQMAQTVDSWHL